MDIDTLDRRFEEARGKRANWDSQLQQIAERVYPLAADFTSQRGEGERRTEVMFDSTAAQAAEKATAAIGTFIWPPNQQYQTLEVDNEYLAKSQRVKEYMDLLTKKLFKARYAPRAGFESQMHDHALQGFIFGSALLFVDDNIRARSLRYKAMNLAQCFMLEDDGGRVDTVFRCFTWSLRQVEQRFPGKLPPKLAERMKTHPDDTVEVRHVVCPRMDYDPGRPDYKGWPWASCYWISSEKAHLEEGGFRSWPFGIMRYPSAPGEVYGRSPAWMALTDIKVLNTMKRTVLQAAQMAVEPPLLLPEESILNAMSLAPGAMNYGGVTPAGQQLVHPLSTGGRVDIGLEMMDKEREIIASSFLLDVFRVLVENPNMTATQTLELMQERATLMSPIAGRIESEDLGPVTEREIELLTHAGALPPMPPELIEARGSYKITYTSPMRRAMRASEAIAITRTLEQVIPLVQVDPSALDGFAPLPEIARELAEINGMPAKLIASPEDVKAKRDQRAQAQQAQSVIEAAPAVSAAAANLTKMQAAGGRPQI